jgi:serpin B
VLAALGMPTAFTQAADFTGMTAQDSAFISSVLHDAYIKVDEAGTEAAAATAVVFPDGGVDATPVTTVVVDRPFLFLIRDDPTGALLFLGRVTDPR